MRPEEFMSIAREMQERWWAFPIPTAALDHYLVELRDFDADAVRAAVTALAAGGLDRPPTSGQIRRRVVEMQLDAPSWDEVRTSLLRWRRSREDRESVADTWACPDGVCDGSSFVPVDGDARTVRDCVCRPRYLSALRGLDQLHPLVAEFVAESHVSRGELSRFLDECDTTTEAQVRQRWSQFAGRAIESRLLAGLPFAGDVPRIEAARAENAAREPKVSDLRRLGDGGLALLQRAS